VSRRPLFWSLFAVAAIAATAFLLPAAADWLVTKDGARIQTDGPWKVEGRLVVFKRPDGTYASMRRTELDLEASERLTLEMVEAATKQAEADQAEQPAKRRQPIARLTEKELPPRGRLAPAGDEQGEASNDSPPAGQESPLQVLRWREERSVEDEGVSFTGQIRNTSQSMALGVTLTVSLTDEEGEQIATTTAELTTDALPPGAIAGFRALFPGVFTYGRANFDVAGALVKSGTPEEAPEGNEAGGR